METQSWALVAEQIVDNRERADVTRHRTIVRKPNLQLEVGEGVFDTANERLKGEREKKGGQWVTLMNAKARLKNGRTKDEVGLNSVGSFDPG